MEVQNLLTKERLAAVFRMLDDLGRQGYGYDGIGHQHCQHDGHVYL